jgi:hypothetical protein
MLVVSYVLNIDITNQQMHIALLDNLLPISDFDIYFGIESLQKFLECQAYFGENKLLTEF